MNEHGLPTLRPDYRNRLHTETLLRERVKELECFYAIAQIAANTAVTVPEAMQQVASRLPAAWQFPEAACTCIEFDGMEAIGPASAGRPAIRQEAPILIGGKQRGMVMVGYPGTFDPGSSAPLLLDEEQRLLTEVARRIASLIERIEARHGREQLQEQLRHADRLATIGQLASGVAHELNEPLGAILGFAQLLDKTPRIPSQARGDIARIMSAALHARDIIRKLMTFARQARPALEPIDLNGLIKESLSLWAWRCEDRGIETVYQLAPSLLMMHADAGQIRQVLINLVVNAIQAMPEGGRLTVATCVCGDMIELSVADTGEGIPADVLPRLFDPFFTTKDVNQGTGLGLSVVDGIVSGHGGRIDVESQPGRGSCIRVHLPLTGRDIHGEDRREENSNGGA